MNPKSRALIETTFFYLIIGMVGWATYQHFQTDDNSILRFLYADLVMTVVAYAFSVFKKNSSVYDAYWTVIPFYFLLAWFVYNDGRSWGIHQWIAAAVVSFWSWRLTLSWARGFPGWHHEDWRYADFRTQFGKLFELVNFSEIHLFPTVIVFLGMLGLFWVFDLGEIKIPTLFYSGAAISFTGAVFQLLADNELARFRLRPNKKKEDIMRTGIWAYSRNPNYLGEIMFWFGLFGMGFAFGAPWYVGIGSVGMLLMFLFASIPMKDKQMAKNRPVSFAKYKQEVPMLIPWYSKKA